MTDGFWLIDKEADWTSFDVCAKLRKQLNIKKVGHTGTLDPFATGLLVVATGKCTRLIPFLEKERKTYVTKMLLGKTSDTLDPESEIRDCTKTLPLARGAGGVYGADVGDDMEGRGCAGNPLSPPFQGGNHSVPSQAKVEEILQEHFTGAIEQVPPQFSAIKVNGKRSYDLARKGEKVDLKPRPTEVFSIKILDYQFPELTLELTVAAGFYVRSLARDLGEMLAGGGLCQELRRTRVGELSVDDAEKLDMITQPIDPRYIVTALDQREIPTGRVQDFIAGRSFPLDSARGLRPGVTGEKVLVLVGGQTIGVGEFVAGKLQPRVVM